MHGFRSISLALAAAALLSASGCGGGGGGGGGESPDTTGPTLNITAPAASTTYVVSSTVVVDASFSDPSGVASFSWSKDGVTFTSVAFSGTSLSTNVDLGTLTDGTAVVVIFRATDSKGNSSELTRTFVPDLNAPAVAITSHAVDGNCSGAACVGAVVNGATTSPWTLSGTATDAALAPAGLVQFRVDPLPSGAPLVDEPLAVTAGAWSYAFTAFPADGSYRVTVSATDSQSRTTSVQRAFVVDRTPPALAITSPSAADCTGATCTGAVINATGNWVSGAAPTIDGTVSDSGSGLATFAVQVDGGAPAPLAHTSTWSYSVAGTFSSGEDGVAHGVGFAAADKAGNVATASLAIGVDNVLPYSALTAPLATNVSPVGGGASPAALQVTGTVAGGTAGIASATYKWTSTGTTTTLPLVAGAFDVSGLAYPASTDYAAIPFRLDLVDKAGNVAAVTHSIYVDNVPPTYAYDASSYAILASTGTSTSFTGRIDDGSYGTAILAPHPTVAVRVRRFSDSNYSVPLTISTTPMTNDLSFGANWNGIPSGIDGSSDYYLEITVTDAAGNSLTEADMVLSIDNVRPRIKTVAQDGTDGWLVSGQRFVAKTAPLVEFSEPMAAATMTAGNPATAAFGLNVSTGASNLQLASDDGGYSWHFPSGTYPYSHSSLTMTLQTDAYQATDLAGNPVATASPGSQTFLVEADPFPLSTPVALPASTTIAYGHPRVSVDPDGFPYVAYGATTLGRIHVAAYTGWTAQYFRSWTYGTVTNPVTLGDFRVCISDVNATTLYRSTSGAFAYLFGAETSGRTQIGYRTASFGWPTDGMPNGTGTQTWDTNVGGNTTFTTPARIRQPTFLPWARTANTLADCSREILHVDDGATTPTFKATLGTSDFSPSPAIGVFTAGVYTDLKQRGAAMYENCGTTTAQSTCIRYRDPGIGTVDRLPGTENTERTSSISTGPIHAVTSAGQPYQGTGTTQWNQNVQALGPAFIAAVANFGITTVTQRLYAYCTATPGTDGSWTSGNVSLGSWASGGTVKTVHDLQVAQSTGAGGKWVVAVSTSENATDDGVNPVVRVYSVDAPGTACPTTLTPTLIGTLTGMKQGSVAIGPSGEVYVTYIDPTANGGDGAAILMRLN